MPGSTNAQAASRFAYRLRIFKLVFVPLLIFSLAGQIAVVWTQWSDIRDGYFDFVLYHSAARIIADGNGAQLYDLAVQKDYQKDARVAPQTRPLPFNHLPYELLALLPLAPLSFPAAHVVWAAMNLLVMLAILIRLAPFVAALPRHLSALMFVAFFPTLTTLKMGQDSLLTTYLLTEIFISLKRGRTVLAGCVLGMGLYKPQLFLPLTALLLCQRRWRAIGAFLATAGALMGISLTMVGWRGLSGLLALWLPMTERGNVVWPELMINLRGLLFMVLNLVGLSSVTNLLTLALSLLVFCVTLRCWRGTRAGRSDGIELNFALAVVMTALVSFHLYSYDSLILALPLLLMLNHALNGQLQTPVQRAFLPLLSVMFFPLLPNVLLGYAVLAWWALPVPILFGLIAREIGEQTQLAHNGAPAKGFY